MRSTRSIVLFLMLWWLFSGSARAEVLVFSPDGSHVASPDLAAAAAAADGAGKKVVVTSPQLVTSVVAWPPDRELVFERGGWVTYSGAGALTGLPVAKPQYFGAKGDGVHDDTAAIVSAIAASRVVVFERPSSFYRVTAPIRIPSLTSLRGEWNHTGLVGTYHQNKPGIRKTTNTAVAIPKHEGGGAVARDCIFYIDPVFTVEGPAAYYTQKIEISGLNIQGAAGTLVDTAIYVEQGGNYRFCDLDITDVKHAFYGRNVWSTVFSNVQAQARIHILSGTSVKLDSCSSGGSSWGYDGFRLENMLYSSMINCTSDHGHESSYTFKGCYSLTLISCGSERATSTGNDTGTGFNFLGDNMITVEGGFVVTPSGTKPKISVMAGDKITFRNAGLFVDEGSGPVLYVQNDASGAGLPAWVTFENSYFVASLWSPRVTFAPGTNRAQVVVRYQGNTKIYTSSRPKGVKYGSESGTWTPVLSFNGGTAGISYAAQAGTYAINGNVVTAQGTVQLNSKGSSAGVAAIRGLPYATRGDFFASGNVGLQSGLARRAHAVVRPGEADILMLDDASSPLTNTDFSDTSALRFSISYQLPDDWGPY